MSTSMLDVVLLVKLNFGPDNEYHMSMLVGFYLMENNRLSGKLRYSNKQLGYYMLIPVYNWSPCEDALTKNSGVE